MNRLKILIALFCLLLALCAIGLADGGVLTLPSGVTVIEDEAFAGLRETQAIELPATVTAIGAGAFRDCGDPAAELRYYSPPAGISVGEGAFEGCRVTLRMNGAELPHLSYEVGEDGVTITGMSGQPTEVVIPDTIAGKPVTAIGNGVFSGKTAMTRAAIPATVTSIGNNAFYNCQALTKIDLPAGLTSLGERAFRECRALTEITLPAGIIAIPAEAFRADVSMTKIEFLGPVVSIGSDAFNDCYALSEMEIPATVTSIGERAFRYCEALPQAVIPSGVTILPNEVFSRCNALASVQLPAGLTSIGEYAFYLCARLTQINFPNNLISIGKQAFNGACRNQPGNLVYTLPDSLETVGDGAFNACDAALCIARGGALETMARDNGYTFTYDAETGFRYLYKTVGEIYVLYLTGYTGPGGGITLPEWPAVIGERAFIYNEDITSVTIPGNYATVDRWAFEACPNLASVVLSEGVTTVCDGAFKNCASLTDVAFPASLTAIKGDAFADSCKADGLHYYRLPDGLTECNNYAFSNNGAVLCVTRGSAAAALVSDANYIFAYGDSPDFLYSMGYYGSGRQLGLYSYVGTDSPLRLPDDCEAVRYDGFKDLVAGGLICAQLSDTADALSRAQLNFTFPGHESIRYRIIDNVLYVMGYAGMDSAIVIPQAADYIDAGWDEQIRAAAFLGNAAVTKAVIPEGVTRINSDAFSGCENLTDITLPDSLKIIDQKAFLGCGKNLEAPFYLVLPDHMEDLSGRGGGANAFEGTNAVLVCGKTSQTAALVSDRNYVYTCPGETDYRYRYETYSHDSDAGRQVWLVGYEGDGATANIPAGVYGMRLYSSNTTDTNWPTFHANGFYGNDAVTKVIIPEGVVDIRSDVFTNCYHLADITFPSTLKHLDQNVFRYCGRDAAEPFYFVLPDNLEDMSGRGGGATTFSDCNAILVVAGKTSATAALLSDSNYVYSVVGETDFRYRYETYPHDSDSGRQVWLVGYEGSDTSVSIPAGIYGIRRYSSNTDSSYWRTFHGDAFYGMENLQKVVIPEGTAVIEDSAFCGCERLTDITFPKSLKVMKNHAFERCGKASDLRHYYILPDQMTEISTSGWGAFTDINLGTLVCTYDSETAKLVSNCYSGGYEGAYNFAPLGHQTDGLLYRYERHGEASDYKYQLYLWDYVGTEAEVIIPDDIELYGVSRTPPGGSDSWHPAFYNNKTLKKIVIPEGVEIIQDSAFANCTLLTDITLPSTLKYIRNHAFENTGTLSDTRFYAVLPAGLLEMQCGNGAGWGSFNESAAVIVSPPSTPVSHDLYESWWQFYTSLENAQNRMNLVRKDNDDPNFKWYGNM